MFRNSLVESKVTVPRYPIKSISAIKNPTFPLMRKQAIKTVKENGLESQISYVKRQTLDKQPGDRFQVQRFIMERHVCHGKTSGYYQRHQPQQRSDITTEKCKQGKYPQNNQCDNGINASK